jgi:hypothetical protein
MCPETPVTIAVVRLNCKPLVVNKEALWQVQGTRLAVVAPLIVRQEVQVVQVVMQETQEQ